ncbi:Sds3-like-domain-containing protein [Dichomitus squalens]|uniref:Sds3-like-domain-containing protein n=1 Tax=Dichomitus squalens TaxID=114155 RepID=A0A4V2K6J4_9APHY|nr:Sds3-like-domain-containing protein [Dichomitus squalens]
MPSSTVSLESLSSPSPSPPPAEPEEQHEQHSGAGLDSGSELSELTEDEQDNDGAIDDEVPRASARKKKQQRASVVPQPMWDWATKKKPEKKDKADWRSKFEEEEEEEQPGPAEAMEEEEEDDYAQYKDSESERDLTPDMEENGDGHGDGVSDNEVDENEQDPPEDEDESGDEVPFQTAIAVPNGNVSGDEVYDPEDAEPEPDALDDPQSPKAVASPALTDDENHDAGEDEVDDEDVPETGEITKEGSEVDEEELPADDVDADADIPVEDEQPTTEAVTPVEGVVDAADPDPDATMDVDVVLPVLPSPVAGTSIMAGLLRPPSPSSSQPSTPSASRLSSRYPSVEPEQEQDVPSEPEAEPEPERKPSGRAARNRKTKPRTRAARRSRAAAPAEAGDGDPDADQAELPEGEGADADDLEVPTPELDLDADMQPAHRAEALDELAKIELKFALLRERLYVEKMDSLAWEEGLIADGTHPELLHLHAELSSRRDKRLELAARRRDYEIANVTKRRRLDEAGAWSSWSNARDELQTQMIAETNGKKRKLERERRTLERPPPPRRFPLPLHEVPPAPSLSEIVQSSPFGLPESASALLRRTSRKKESASQIPLAYPTLAPLSRHEIIQDLDHFYSHRHVPVGYDPHRNVTGPMNPVLGGIPQGMDPYAMGMHMMDGPNRFGPPIQQQHLPQQGMVQGFPPPPRLSHQHSAPSGGLPHVPSHHQLQLEQEMQMRQPPGMQHLHVAQQFGGGPGPGTLMRRSISPVPLNGAGPGAGVPTTIGGGPVPPAFANPKSNGWPGGRESKRINGEGKRSVQSENGFHAIVIVNVIVNVSGRRSVPIICLIPNRDIPGINTLISMRIITLKCKLRITTHLITTSIIIITCTTITTTSLRNKGSRVLQWAMPLR